MCTEKAVKTAEDASLPVVILQSKLQSPHHVKKIDGRNSQIRCYIRYFYFFVFLFLFLPFPAEISKVTITYPFARAEAISFGSAMLSRFHTPTASSEYQSQDSMYSRTSWYFSIEGRSEMLI